jgi:hypothetical protein
VKAAALIAALLPVMAAAQDTAPGRDAFVAAVEAAGCHLTQADAGAVLQPLGFTPDVTQKIVDDLVAEGVATVDETGLTLKTETCT